MINTKKLEKGNVRVVYDISADGTFVNALGMNVLHNTDGWMVSTFKYLKRTDIPKKTHTLVRD